MERNERKTRVGTVVSDKMEKSATVAVERSYKNQKYGKVMKITNKFLIHDEKNECHPGDLVKIMETRPMSKRKRWRLVEIIEKAK
ncbi:MAG TPA: 30S ribosomal protein S17 [Catalimonadaceae bacterium]|nr:30S ribosomal protein S17 [Catalimonadaceae bacterium]